MHRCNGASLRSRGGIKCRSQPARVLIVAFARLASPSTSAPHSFAKRFSGNFPSLAKEGLGVVRSTTTQICSEIDRTTPSPLLCQGGEAFAKVVSLGKAAPHSRSITEHAAGTPLDVGGGME